MCVSDEQIFFVKTKKDWFVSNIHWIITQSRDAKMDNAPSNKNGLNWGDNIALNRKKTKD